MNGHNITNESLALSMVLVLIAILVSYREKLALEKDIIWSICRAIVQLIIVGGNDSNLLIVFYVQIVPDDFVMQLHRF